MIVDIESTVSAIESAVNDAELMSGKQVTSAFVGISGGHINGLNSEGVVGIKDKKWGEVPCAFIEKSNNSLTSD